MPLGPYQRIRWGSQYVGAAESWHITLAMCRVLAPSSASPGANSTPSPVIGPVTMPSRPRLGGTTW